MSKLTRMNRFRLVIGAVLVVPLLVAGVAAAQEEFEIMETQSQDQPVSDDRPNEKPGRNSSDEPMDARLRSRLEERKEKFQIKLNAQQTARIKNRCKPAQVKIQQYAQRVTGVEVSQDRVYGNLIDRLIKLSAKLDKAGVETAELNQQISILQGKTDELTESIETFKVAVSDAADLDCAQDPEGFKASLEEARKMRQDIHDNAKAVKKYLRNELRPALQNIKSQLANTGSEAEEAQ